MADFWCVFLCVWQTPAQEVKRENARRQLTKPWGRGPGWGGQRTTAGYSLVVLFFVLSSPFVRLNLFEFKNRERKNTQKPASYAGYSIKSFWMKNSTNRGALGSTHPALHISHNAPYFSPKFCITLFYISFLLYITGVWKNRKPESGIGTGMGTGTGTGTGNSNGTETAMWRGTDTRTGISFTLNYFNSNSIYTKNKNTTLVSCSPPNLFIIRQREGRKSRKLNK